MPGLGGLAFGQVALLFVFQGDDTGAVVVNTVVGQGTVAFGHIHHPEAVGKSANAKGEDPVIYICDFLEFHIAQVLEAKIHANVFQDLPCHGVQAPVQSFPHRNIPVIRAAAVGWAVFPLMVVYHPGRMVFARIKCRGIVQQRFDGAARLPGA